jgi:hypothetical protein
MEQKILEALNSVGAKRGMGVVRKADKDTSHREATRVSLPRSQKKRKYNARHRQKSAEWLAKKKLEALDLHPSDLQTISDTSINAFADVLAIPTAQVDIVANPPAGSYTGPSYKLPLPMPFGDAPPPEPVLTLSQARDRGLPTHYMGDTKVWLYRKVHGALHWTACAGQSESAPPTTGKFMSPLYDRPPVRESCPGNFTGRKCPPNAPRCTGNC